MQPTRIPQVVGSSSVSVLRTPRAAEHGQCVGVSGPASVPLSTHSNAPAPRRGDTAGRSLVAASLVSAGPATLHPRTLLRDMRQLAFNGVQRGVIG